MDILYLLDRLEEVISSARRFPLSSNVIVDPQECLDIVDQIRLTLPEEIKLARRVVAERDQLLSEATARAERVVERAEEQAAARIEDHSLVRAAEDRAQAALDEARREAQDLRRQVDEYSYNVLASLNKRLLRLQGTIQEGLQELSSEPRPGGRAEEN